MVDFDGLVCTTAAGMAGHSPVTLMKSRMFFAGLRNEDSPTYTLVSFQTH